MKKENNHSSPIVARDDNKNTYQDHVTSSVDDAPTEWLRRSGDLFLAERNADGFLQPKIFYTHKETNEALDSIQELGEEQAYRVGSRSFNIVKPDTSFKLFKNLPRNRDLHKRISLAQKLSKERYKILCCLFRALKRYEFYLRFVSKSGSIYFGSPNTDGRIRLSDHSNMRKYMIDIRWDNSNGINFRAYQEDRYVSMSKIKNMITALDMRTDQRYYC